MKKTTAEMNRLTVEQFQQAPKVPLVVVLDNIRSQHNVGAVFRTADAFCLQGVYLCGICCCPPNDEIHKTALGAELSVEWKYFEDTLEAVRSLQSDGYSVYAIEQAHDSVTLEEAVGQLHDKKVAVVLGHEVFGVQQAVVDACAACVEIPQYGTKHSLNVSVTAGIVMYQFANALRR